MPQLQNSSVECVDGNTSHVFFLIHLAHVITLTSWLKVSQCAFHSIHMPSMMSHVWAFIVSSCLSLSLVSLLLQPLLFHILPVLCPALHLQCRHRRGLKPLHSRRMRSIDPWRYTILSHHHQDLTLNLHFQHSLECSRILIPGARISPLYHLLSWPWSWLCSFFFSVVALAFALSFPCAFCPCPSAFLCFCFRRTSWLRPSSCACSCPFPNRSNGSRRQSASEFQRHFQVTYRFSRPPELFASFVTSRLIRFVVSCRVNNVVFQWSHPRSLPEVQTFCSFRQEAQGAQAQFRRLQVFKWRRRCFPSVPTLSKYASLSQAQLSQAFPPLRPSVRRNVVPAAHSSPCPLLWYRWTSVNSQQSCSFWAGMSTPVCPFPHQWIFFGRTSCMSEADTPSIPVATS